jgi:hypothetical protein
MMPLALRRATSKSGWNRRLLLAILIIFWALIGVAQAQAPAWALATTAAYLPPFSFSQTRGTAADANGNILVTGSFVGTMTFGAITLTSRGSNDIFLAKYVPATNTWAWAVGAGGTAADLGYDVAVSGSSVYLTASIGNTAANTYNVLFDGAATPSGTAPQAGASGTILNVDVVVAKYTDNGTSATLNWTQVAGGSTDEAAANIAVNGNSVYVTGTIQNNRANATGVLLGGSGTTPGTGQLYGAGPAVGPDGFLLKYLDNGNSATVAWAQLMGGTGDDACMGVAVVGPNIYTTGYLTNNTANANSVVFGGTGTTAGTAPQYGATATASRDIFLAKYVDSGSAAAVAWTQVAGGDDYDSGFQIAASGSAIYVAGRLVNDLANTSQVLFGGSGTTPGTYLQYGVPAQGGYAAFLVAKYTDLGTSAAFGWSQVAGGRSDSNAFDVVVDGPHVYATGGVGNVFGTTNQTTFGGTGTTPGTITQLGATSSKHEDLVVAHYLDNGASSSLVWTQIGGSTGTDYGMGLALSGNRLYVAGVIGSPATFGSFTLTSSAAALGFFLGALPVQAFLATAPAVAGAAPQLYPNPASGTAVLQGVAPRTAVAILDALGRRIATAAADATGTAALPAGLPPGLYVVQAGSNAVRWLVE